MERETYLTHLAADVETMAAAARAAGLDAAVPSCPDWTVKDLCEHTAEVFEHKRVAVETGARPDPWPPAWPERDPIDWLIDAHSRLQAAFAVADPAAQGWTWFEPDQSKDFWWRRMAQEAVIHRVDAELAAGQTSVVDDDLAVDGLDEVLVRFLAYGYSFEDNPEGNGEVIELAAGDLRWTVQINAETVAVRGVRESSGEVAGAAPDATVTGTPAQLLLWAWARGDDAGVEVQGDPAAIAKLRFILSQACT